MRVLLFAHLKDVLGATELEIKLPDTFDAETLWRELIAAHPQLAAFRKTTRVARNGEYANDKTHFTNADEIALIPPVSGG